METTDRSVSSIIAAFRSSLKEFKSYRERKRKHKRSSSGGKAHKAIRARSDEASSDESKLSLSLRQGAVDVQTEYDRHFRTLGDEYAIGDFTAQSSLGRTLRKLNNCLRNIIQSLLAIGQNDPKVDYRYLTSVSDISRQEALDALSQLSYRMSVSALNVLHEQQDVKERRRKSDSDKAVRKKQQLPRGKSESDVPARLPSAVRSSDNGAPFVRKVHLRSASTPQLAMVRPKPRRSSSAKSDVAASQNVPSPKQMPAIPRSIQPREMERPTKETRPPAEQSRPAAQPNIGKKRCDAAATQPVIEVVAPIDDQVQPSTNLLPHRRRLEKITPSTYTYASIKTDSTRLGEIPEMKWSIPLDQGELDRLNKEHSGRPWPPPQEPLKPRRGWFGMFTKKGEGQVAEVGA